MKRFVGIVMAIAVIFAAPIMSNAEVSNNSDDLSLLFLNSSDNTDASAGIDEAEWSESTPLATSMRNFNLNKKMTFNLQADDGGSSVSAVAESSSNQEKKNPGRALLLSAIMPGSGELYAGSTLKAALFFAIEVGCWYGAVSFAQQGADKEDEYEAFADKHYLESYYREVEYQAALDKIGDDDRTMYNGPATEWVDLSWEAKLPYLPGNFTHELANSHNQQYFENVGKYLTQFGWGWEDWIGDLSETLVAQEADGLGWNWKKSNRSSAMVYQYIDMRAESNDLLDQSANFFSLIMVNHVLSALDAGFTVRKHNKKLAEVETNVGQIFHNDRPIAVAGLSVRF